MLPPRSKSRLTAAGLLVTAAPGLVGCAGSSSTPQATLKAFLTAWQTRDWTAMKRQVASPPADFITVTRPALRLTPPGEKPEHMAGLRVLRLK